MSSDPHSNRTWLLGYIAVYAILACVLAAVLYQTYVRPIFVAEPVRVVHTEDQDSPEPPDNRLNPNTAAWYDLARLPGLGEVLAKRIVNYREAKLLEWQQTHPGADASNAPPAYVRLQDLDEVKGIGPKLLAKLQPYLAFNQLDAPAALPPSDDAPKH